MASKPTYEELEQKSIANQYSKGVLKEKMHQVVIREIKTTGPDSGVQWNIRVSRLDRAAVIY